MATGDGSIDGPRTHVLHYGGRQLPLHTEHALAVADLMKRASNESVTGVVRLDITDKSGETVEVQLLIGPGIPVLLEGPSLPRV